MTKVSKWKVLFIPIMLDKYSRKDILAGMGITSFAMLGIFVISIIFGLAEITHIDFDLQAIVYYTGITFRFIVIILIVIWIRKSRSNLMKNNIHHHNIQN